MRNKIQIARYLRQEQTPAEKRLWKYLRNRQFENLKFRRQHPIKNYIVDFICLEKQFIIELNGEIDNNISQKEKDALRDKYLSVLGYHTLRFENKIVFEQPELILKSIENIISSSSPELEDRGEGIKTTLSQPSPNKEKEFSKNEKIRVLSTKILTLAQKELLLNAGISFVEYDGLKIESIPIKEIQLEENIIITSKNAFGSIQNSAYWSALQEKNWWVVGERTSAVLQENKLKIKVIGKNAEDLAKKIIKADSNVGFTFFTGNKRREELPELLTEHRIKFREYCVYNTVLKPKKIDSTFDGILFFSPSGVESYTLENRIKNEVCFCIGTTTASEVKKHTNNIVIATKATIENVIVQVVKHMRK